MLLAGIDIGTLTCRLLVAEINPPDEFREVFADRRILRLGEGVDEHKCLSSSAMNRVLATLREWKNEMAAFPIRTMAVVATSAVRESNNRHEFLERIRLETGWEVEVLSGKEEARRTLLGIRFGLPERPDEFFGLDIGGGSTECILDRKGQDPLVQSLDLGVVRLIERVFPHDPPTLQDVQDAEACIDEELIKLDAEFGSISSTPLVGTAGTITTLAAMAQRLKKYDRHRIHNFELTIVMVKELEHQLRQKTGSERLSMPGLEPGREFVIIAGTVILRRVMESLGFRACLVSDYGLREGVLVDKAFMLMR